MKCFDCRISQLPAIEKVVDYFRWRQEDAHRNSLLAHCYWCLRRDGKTARSATSMMEGLSLSDYNEILFQHNINYNDLPSWQKRGVGLYWEKYEKQGHNPITGEDVPAIRMRIKKELDLPMKEEYSQFIQNLLSPTILNNRTQN